MHLIFHPASAELEPFPMKRLFRQAVAGQGLAQRFAPGGGAAEPDAGAGFETFLDVGGVGWVGQAAVQA
jgi:hypothetical protein